MEIPNSSTIDNSNNKQIYSSNEIALNTSQFSDAKSTYSTLNSLCNSETSESGSECEVNLIVIESCPNSPKKKNTIKDFEISHLLGKGSYGKVYLARNIYTNKYYALKIIDKFFLTKQEKEYEVHIEKYILSNLNHPNIVKLYSTFQDSKKLYFILEYCQNKDLSDFIRSERKLSLDKTKNFAAQIVSALEYMHSKGIYHRDLKPENIILDENMNLKLCDFATANIKGMYFDKTLMKFIPVDESEKLETINQTDHNFDNMNHDFVGTADYVSPEILEDKSEIGPAVDMWALGCIIFYALHGRTPFKAKTDFLIFDKIIKNDFTIDEKLDLEAKDLINKLLVSDPYKRLGCGSSSTNDFSALKSHPFFKDIDWIKLTENSRGKSGYTPFISSSSKSLLHRSHSISNSLSSSMDNNLMNISSGSSSSSNNLYNVVYPNFNPNRMSNLSLINDNDNVIFRSTVQKKSPWFHYNTRLLELLSDGLLKYYEPKGYTLKGTIKLTKECKAVFVDDFEFNVVCTNRTFIFKVSYKIARKWVDKINQVIQLVK